MLKRWVRLYHPDTQGPMDNAELAWGSDIFLAFYDTPDLLAAFLDLMADHFIHFLNGWFALAKPEERFNTHWGMMFRGAVMLRDDSLMNLSPEIYETFVRDREQRCLRELGGEGCRARSPGACPLFFGRADRS